MTRAIHAAILGASGYGASELLRLLTQHPDVQVVSVTSTSRAGQRIDAVHPHLRGFYDLMVSAEIDEGRLFAADRAVVFSTLPHGVSGEALAEIIERIDRVHAERACVVDLSGDLRLADVDVHRRFYADSAPLPELRGRFRYGLPELFREEVRSARCIANPGCLATACILAAAPLIELGPEGPLVMDAKTGSSGSGRQLKEATHHPTRHADFQAYKALEHQHEPEILQALGDVTGSRLRVSFVPQSMDAARGIFATVHATLGGDTDAGALKRRYEAFYAECPFVRVVDGSPTLQDVVGSNFCDIAVAARGRQVIAMAALDNLVKGMAGAAIQNMNLMCGLPETRGLWTPSLRPV